MLPIAVPIGLVARLLPGKKTMDRTPEDMAGFLSDLSDGIGGQCDGDEFEKVPIIGLSFEALARPCGRI